MYNKIRAELLSGSHVSSVMHQEKSIMCASEEYDELHNHIVNVYVRTCVGRACVRACMCV